jgi:hypothetical protein
MRAIRAASVALTGIAALGLSAPAVSAVAPDRITSFGFKVSPTEVKPGGTVSVVVWACQEGGITVSSPVFDTVGLEQGESKSVTVDWDASPGAQYDVTFTCGRESADATLTIESSSGGDRKAGGDQGQGSREQVQDHGKRFPRGGVHGGLGGTLRGGLAGADAPETLAGAALLAAALSGGSYAMGRRARRA